MYAYLLFLASWDTFKNHTDIRDNTFMHHNKRHHDKTSPDELVVEEIGIADLNDVYELGERLFTADKWPALYRTWDEYEVVTFFASDSETCFVARQGSHVLGFALGNIIEKRNSSWRYGYLVWLGVDPAFGRNGVGTALFNAMRDKFIQLGARMILVDTDANNSEAIQFFKKSGFDHANKHIYLSLNLTHSPEYRKRMPKKQPKTLVATPKDPSPSNV